MKNSQRAARSLFYFRCPVGDTHIGRPLHVGLSATKPNLTEHYIRKFPNTASAFNLHGIWATGLTREQVGSPTAPVVDNRIYRIGGILGGNYLQLFGRFTPTPYRHTTLLLQNHSIGKQSRQTDLRYGTERYEHAAYNAYQTTNLHLSLLN